MIGWFYILQLSNSKYYLGSTTNFPKRIRDHKEGNSIYTKKFLPLKVVFKQKFSSYGDARRVEVKLKRLKNKKIIEKIVKNQQLTVEVG